MPPLQDVTTPDASSSLLDFHSDDDFGPAFQGRGLGKTQGWDDHREDVTRYDKIRSFPFGHDLRTAA